MTAFNKTHGVRQEIVASIVALRKQPDTAVQSELAKVPPDVTANFNETDAVFRAVTTSVHDVNKPAGD